MLGPNRRDLDRHGTLSVDRRNDRAGSSRSPSGSLPPQQRLLNRRCPSQLRPDQKKSNKIRVFLSLKSLEGVWLDVCGCMCLWATMSATSRKMKAAPQRRQADPLPPASGIGIQSGHWLGSSEPSLSLSLEFCSPIKLTWNHLIRG